jgi:tRNA-specific 2-thiouridylase
MTDKKKIVLGMSGGVDSSVSAYLLKQQGYEVIGLFMQNWDDVTNSDVLGHKNDHNDQCNAQKDFNDAKAVADVLGIKLYRTQFIDEY